jgi:cytochrome c oxidase subunit 2
MMHPQSALTTAGRDAEWIAELFVWMTIGALAIWIAVLALAFLAPRWRSARPERTGSLLIIGGGVVFPLVVLTALLTYGLAGIPRLLAPGSGDLAIEVSGRQWWWRVRYVIPGGTPIVLANEIALPVGRRISLRLMSEDVIHSFWLPAIAGKMDMVPGRVTHLALEPTRAGTFRGACAEFCGTAHARMNFVAVTMEPAAFDAWLDRQAQPAAEPADDAGLRGRRSFFARGCAGCHTIRGTTAVGVVGPDLTHVASRQTIAAGLLAVSREQLARWIAQTELLKPGVHMPAFKMVPEAELTDLATYLAGLQ